MEGCAVNTYSSIRILTYCQYCSSIRSQEEIAGGERMEAQEVGRKEQEYLEGSMVRENNCAHGTTCSKYLTD